MNDSRRGGRPPTAIGIAFIVVLATIAAVNVVRSLWLPQVSHLLVALALATATIVIGTRAGMSESEIGLGSWRRGAAFGTAAAIVIVLGLIGIGLASRSFDLLADLFDDERATVDLAELLVRIIVIIPVGTVLVEELIFRGVVLGQLLRMTTRRRALIVSSLAFGLWHVLPTALDSTGTAADIARAVAVTFAVTTAAGVGFGALRLASGSLLAPIIAHTATNSGALATAWLLV